MSKRQKFEKVNLSFYFQPFKRHSFTFIRPSEADKTRKVYRELEKREHLCWDQVKKKRLLCWNKGEEEAVAGWQQQLAVGDRRRVSDWRMTVKVINIYIYIYIYICTVRISIFGWNVRFSPVQPAQSSSARYLEHGLATSPNVLTVVSFASFKFLYLGS